ncbi:trypsin-like peptidase domain-containing protein [Candidatus Dependentiae bacterium]|nr:trypsin-like peptidase domain-containing protein [Candidatus Dependentiae bacterium]
MSIYYKIGSISIALACSMFKAYSFELEYPRSITRSSGLAQQSYVEWHTLEKRVQNTVVQVWSQGTTFNWLEPYKAPEQHQGAGTAFFINAEGYLLTNFHVIEGAKSVFIHVPILGQRLLDVTIVGVCPETDVALLKLSDESSSLVKAALGEEIPYLQLGDSDILYPTEPVLALGYPLGQRYLKATDGRIAGREYSNGKSYMHITAPINPGNSGGPLLNNQGLVIGINSAGIPQAQNVGYIVPINDVKIILKDFETKQLVRKPDLGIYVNHATDEHAHSLGNPVPGGVYIHYLQANSIAAQAGVKAGDMWYGIESNGIAYVIDEYGDVKVGWRTSDKVTIDELLMRFPAGTPLKLIVYRKGQKLELDCLFNEPPVYPIRFIYPDYESEEIDYEMFGGMCVMQLRVNHLVKDRRGNNLLPQTSLLRLFTRLDHQAKKALVITRILPGSQTHKVGCFYAGALLDTVNGQKVTTLQELREALFRSVQTKEIAITTKDTNATVLSLAKVLKEEPLLARDFMFPLTDTIKNIWQLTLSN